MLKVVWWWYEDRITWLRNIDKSRNIKWYFSVTLQFHCTTRPRLLYGELSYKRWCACENILYELWKRKILEKNKAKKFGAETKIKNGRGDGEWAKIMDRWKWRFFEWFMGEIPLRLCRILQLLRRLSAGEKLPISQGWNNGSREPLGILCLRKCVDRSLWISKIPFGFRGISIVMWPFLISGVLPAVRNKGEVGTTSAEDLARVDDVSASYSYYDYDETLDEDSRIKVSPYSEWPVWLQIPLNLVNILGPHINGDWDFLERSSGQ